MTITKKFGWIEDKPDERDYKFKLSMRAAAERPEIVDLRKKMPPVYDQGDIGSCTSNSTAATIDYLWGKEGKCHQPPSRLFIYYNARMIEGTIGEDAGASNRDAIKSVNKYGSTWERLWPYHEEFFAEKPGWLAYWLGKRHRAVRYERVAVDAQEMETCLYQGFPIVIGCDIYTTFMGDEAAKTGKIPTPDTNTEKYLGGHSMLVCGYRQKDRVFIVRNSWGKGWGDRGYCYMEYDYLLNENICGDYWAVKFTE